MPPPPTPRCLQQHCPTSPPFHWRLWITVVVSIGMVAIWGSDVLAQAPEASEAEGPKGSLSLYSTEEIDEVVSRRLVVVLSNIGAQAVHATISITLDESLCFESDEACDERSRELDAVDIVPGRSHIHDELFRLAELKNVAIITVSAVLTDERGNRLVLSDTHKYDAAPFASGFLEGPLGIAAALLLPGVVSIGIFRKANTIERRRRNLPDAIPAFAAGLGATFALLVALAANYFYSKQIDGVAFWEQYRWNDLLAMTLWTAIATLAVVGLLNLLLRRYWPTSDPAWTAARVLKMMEGEIERSPVGDSSKGFVMSSRWGCEIRVPRILIEGAPGQPHSLDNKKFDEIRELYEEHQSSLRISFDGAWEGIKKPEHGPPSPTSHAVERALNWRSGQ